MHKSDTSRRWFGLRSAARRPLLQDDPADMGTAFGLDLSLGEMSGDVPSPTPMMGHDGWVQRLWIRRKPAC